MKSQYPVLPKTARALSWQEFALPVGLRAAILKQSVEKMDLALPDLPQNGITLTFLHYKGDVRVRWSGQAIEHAASPGSGLMIRSGRPVRFLSANPVTISALAIFIPTGWADLFFDSNAHFRKMEQLMDEEENIITCRLGRRQLSMFATAFTGQDGNEPPLLSLQNVVLTLLEYFLCNRHRSLLGVNPISDIDNEDDLSLIREVESYISEYYCSDTFTVDSILKKTYTSYHRLNFLFKSIHGMTISEYIRNKRIEKSKEMIADNVKSISQIAYEIGYSSISNYILAFKKVYQITPGKYKKQIDNLAG
ncbi:MAG TPA: AraC family transcriptional regulator [Puia sp.]|jgi:AraC-like DNA-binding protein|nr:AraC family transcriptional regulator [Puia sp.]